jgi:2-C-methyl-D-erythritol 2,4-cyclodiphosphate synthase
MYRVGTGFDMHRLVEGRDLILGGVKIDHHLGLEGHSDADVLVHALMDALLGAAALGDIGRHFSMGDPEYKNISSLILLHRVAGMVGQKQWKLVNADMTIIAEEPRMASYIDEMREKIAEILSVSKGCISIKATTTEGLGSSGRGEGIAAQAVVLLGETACPGPASHEAQ